MTKRAYLTVVMLLSLIIGVGCDDSDNNNNNADLGSDMPPTDIVDIAVGNSDFSILVAALQRADLVTTLQGTGPFTVFAPTDAAFEASGLDLDDINAMPVADLTQVLLYHVVSGSVASSAISAGPVDSVAMDTTDTWALDIILGTTAGVTLNGGNAVTGGANVVMADIQASNGIIHVIDRVILPPTIVDMTAYAGLTDLREAVVAASLDTALAGTGPFTVFAPTNAAFPDGNARPTGTELETILEYHVVGAGVPSGSVPARANSISANAAGNNMTLLFDTSSGVAVNGVDVAIADVGCTNGVVHVIDGILLPPTVADMVSIAGLTGLASAIARADSATSDAVSTLLDGDATPATGFTVFAPTNDAFTTAATVLANLSDTEVASALQFHVVDNEMVNAPVLSTGLSNGEVPTLFTDTITVDVGATPPEVEGIAVVPDLLDIHVSNGVVHVISGVMVPPSL